MRRPYLSSRGRLIATALERSWRSSPPLELHLSATEFDEVTPLLYDSGAAGLGWWCIRESGLRDTPSGELLHQAFRLLALQANIHQSKIQKLFQLMRAAGVEPILLKGWAIARLYPQPALRPYGDFDLFVRSRDSRAARRVIESAAPRQLDPVSHRSRARVGRGGNYRRRNCRASARDSQLARAQRAERMGDTFRDRSAADESSRSDAFLPATSSRFPFRRR